MAKDFARGALLAIKVLGAEKGVNQNVVGFESGIGLEFAAPITVLVLSGEQVTSRRVNGGGDAAHHVVNFSEKHLRLVVLRRAWREGRHSYFQSPAVAAGAEAMAATISGGNPKRTFSGMTSTSSSLVKPFSRRNSMARSTRISGAEAPAVSAIV